MIQDKTLFSESSPNAPSLLFCIIICILPLHYILQLSERRSIQCHKYKDDLKIYYTAHKHKVTTIFSATVSQQNVWKLRSPMTNRIHSRTASSKSKGRYTRGQKAELEWSLSELYMHDMYTLFKWQWSWDTEYAHIVRSQLASGNFGPGEHFRL